MHPMTELPDTHHRLSLFAYTVESSAPLYRTLMRLFLDARARYEIHLRPDEVAAALREAGHPDLERSVLDRALDQLHDWGNLKRSHDTARVATLEDFHRRHHVYRMTPAGEAAERAVGQVLDALESSGSLQQVMLRAILRNLEGLAREAELDEPRPEELYRHLFDLQGQFTALTENASTFLTRLHEAVDAGEVDTAAFVLYKQAVLEYLEGFVTELTEIAPAIAGFVERIGARDADALLALAAEADTTPTPEGRRDRSEELRRRWRGIVAWFLGRDGEAPTVDHLRGAARQAINRMLLVLERLHEKRFRRVDRTADLLRLAGWFDRLSGQDDAEAHRLFAAAFGLYGARHLGGLHEDPDLVAPETSWWQARPVPVSPVLRKIGKVSALGRTPRVVRHDETRRYLTERHRLERAARDAALARFADRGPLALGDLPPLTEDELTALLELLGRLLATTPEATGRRRARSADGRLGLLLEGPTTPARVVLTAPHGRIEAPAYVLTVFSARSARA
jgi:uncharacterized protein (TIGR02677 family)